MVRRILLVAPLLAASCSTFALAQSVRAPVTAVPRLWDGIPILAAPAPLSIRGFRMPPPSALASAFIAPSVAGRPALASVRSLTGALSAASARGRDEAPALSAAFDGLKDASSGDGAPAAAFTAPSEEFALRAQRLFGEARRAEAARAARPEGTIPSDDELRGRMERLPVSNPEREKFMIDLFKLAGAKETDVALQDAGRGRRNIMVVKKGRTDRVIVVGAHHDKVRAGLGTIDNGTGATLVANLYQVLHDVETDATIVFIAFAREEEGLIGSRKYVDSLTQEQRARVDAMINLDTLAVDGTFSWRNNSTRALLDRLAQVSRESGRALKEDDLSGGDADSSTFRDAGIPAVTVYGASQDVIFDTIHSGRDNMSAFSLEHYKNAYLLTLEALKSLDRTALGSAGRSDL